MSAVVGSPALALTPERASAAPPEPCRRLRLCLLLLAVAVGAMIGVMLGIMHVPYALLIGVAQNLVAFYISTEWKDAVVFFLLLTALVLRPAGLFGFAVQRRV